MQAQSRDKVVMRSLNKLINNVGPFHYVIDGLNVAYFGDATLSFKKVMCMIMHCTTKLCVQMFSFSVKIVTVLLEYSLF